LSCTSPAAGGGSEVPREIKDMLQIAFNPPATLLHRRPRFCVVRLAAAGGVVVVCN
jgi:hypothetical protein